MSSNVSRRTFLRSAAATVFAYSHGLAQAQRPVIVYVGSYTARGQGIYRYSMNPNTGQLTLLNVIGDLLNPSFLAIDPQQRFLYAGNEIANYESRQSGSVSAFAIEPDGNLRLLNRQPTEGRNPAHVSVDPTGRFVLAANYSGLTAGGGNLVVLPIQRNGQLSPPSDVVTHRGALGPNTARQEAPHAHMVLPDPSGRFVLANDLGLDRTFLYRLDAGSGKLNASDPDAIAAPPGAGPRHLAYHPNGRFVFVLNELNSTLRSLSWDSTRGMLQEIQTISTLPENYAGINTTAHVVVSADGRFVYASNRGHDSIAVFSVDPNSGRLTFIERVWTYGETPRNFAIDPSGSFMYVGHQNTDNIVTFRVDKATGRLSPTGQFIGAGQPVSIVFLTPAQPGNTAREGVTFAANPNPIAVSGASAYGQTTLSWNAPDTTDVEIHIGAPNGPSMGRQLSWGSATTGNWVADGMMFYLQDVSAGRPLDAANTLATVRVTVQQS
jgi:6-phosphogluconolactonase